ncbi:MAG TPA: hypothetical protein VJU61_22430 [Polyangiaceae bacterium]|nr:hypothetical protein [Polyangiaceae bacterium]
MRLSSYSFCSLAVLVGVLAIPTRADARPRRYYRYEEHERPRAPDHQGLLLRAAVGAGGLTADDDLNDVALSGAVGAFSLDVGGSLTPDLALHGRLAFNSMFEPTISSSGEELSELDDTSLTFTLLGLGLTYYLPSNLYLTGVVGLSRASFQYYGEEYDALNGVGFMGDIGYEWLIGGDWGLGLAGRLELHTVSGDGERLNAAGLGVVLSATYF